MKKAVVLLGLVASLAGAAPPSQARGRAEQGTLPPPAARGVLEKAAAIPPAQGLDFWESMERLARVKAQRAKLAPAPITFDEKLLSARDRQVLRHLVDASRQLDAIYLVQMYSRNLEIQKRLEASKDPVDKVLLSYFRLCAGPFDRLDAYRNFIDAAVHPQGANFYPEDMTREEFEGWIKAHPQDREAFMSPYTVIRRKAGNLVAVPYSVEYRQWLVPAAASLRKAAALTSSKTFRHFLETRAAALLSNDYYESDVAWMDVRDCPFEVVFGPYEVYQDHLFNYKASFEAFITINDPREETKLSRYAGMLRDMEANLPIPDEHKNFKRKFESPIRVVQEILDAGDARAGVQTSAFNLPNDEKVRENKGCKKVMLKNVMQAKFSRSTMPIAQRVVEPSQLPLVRFDSYFHNVLFHELSHGLGPGTIVKDGVTMDSAQALKNLHSGVEELKADITGLYNELFLIQKGVIPESERKSICVSYLVGIFRSVRFGAEEAHGKGTLVQYNFLLERGAIRRDAKTGRHSVDFTKFEPALRDLVNQVLMIQAKGDYEGASRLLARYGVVPHGLRRVLDGLRDIPIDIEPVFSVH